MKLFKFYADDLYDKGGGVYLPIKIAGNTIEGFQYTTKSEAWSKTQDHEWTLTASLSFVVNIEDDWKDESIINADAAPDKHQLIETVFIGIKE